MLHQVVENGLILASSQTESVFSKYNYCKDELVTTKTCFSGVWSKQSEVRLVEC